MTLRDRSLHLGRGIVLGALVGVVCGVASAVFLAALGRATGFRIEHGALVFALPVAGLAIGWASDRFGKPVEGGNNLVIDTIHDGGPPIPLRMAPMVLVGTVLTHLFGGSAGREGTAVQMGASLSDGIARRLRIAPVLRADLISAGVAGGFGSVFGTPLAGAAFGMEFIVVGRFRYRALVPALVASYIGDATTRACGVDHGRLPPLRPVALSLGLMGRWVLFAAAVALVVVAFIESTHRLKQAASRLLPNLPIRLALGGAAVVLLWHVVGTDAYLGLGLPLLERAFVDPSLPNAAFAWKLVFTVVTLGMGFIGGEVTPLFVIGGTLGNVLARLIGVPMGLGAAVGLAAMFAAASNTPVALSVMAFELFGAAVFPHVVIVCALATVFSGDRSIYSSQRLPSAVAATPTAAIPDSHAHDSDEPR